MFVEFCSVGFVYPQRLCFIQASQRARVLPFAADIGGVSNKVLSSNYIAKRKNGAICDNTSIGNDA